MPNHFCSTFPCPVCNGGSTAVGVQSFTFRQTVSYTDWRIALGEALRLSRGGQAEGKPRVSRMGAAWVVSWKPRYIAFNATA